MKVYRLQWDQCLIVMHAERGIIGTARLGVKHRVGRQGAARIYPSGTQFGESRLNDLDLLPTETARLTRVRIEPGDRKYWTVDAEVMA